MILQDPSENDDCLPLKRLSENSLQSVVAAAAAAVVVVDVVDSAVVGLAACSSAPARLHCRTGKWGRRADPAWGSLAVADCGLQM